METKTAMKWTLALLVGFGIIVIGFRFAGWLLTSFFVLNCLVLIIVVLLQSGKAADLAGAFGVAALGERGLGRRGRASRHGYLLAADFGEEAVEKLRSGFGVPKGSGDAHDLQFGAAQGERDGEGIVDVVADISVDDYFFWEGRSWRRLAIAGG